MTSFPPPKLQYKLAVVDIQEHRLAKIALWRSCFITICLLSLGCMFTFPLGKITEPQQIRISGQKLVDEATIYQVLNFDYPQLIWTIKVKDLTQKVESVPSIEFTNIKRQILPPRLIISLQEKIPVAIATFDGKVGFLDLNGTWTEQKFYTNLDRNFTLPKLTVHNYQPQYQKSWTTLHQLISLYPELKINEVQWTHSGKLFLQTKIGRVLLGTNLLRLEQQFEIMLKLQNLNDRVDREKIAYIDLSNPKVNLIQKY